MAQPLVGQIPVLTCGRCGTELQQGQRCPHCGLDPSQPVKSLLQWDLVSLTPATRWRYWLFFTIDALLVLAGGVLAPLVAWPVRTLTGKTINAAGFGVLFMIGVLVMAWITIHWYQRYGRCTAGLALSLCLINRRTGCPPRIRKDFPSDWLLVDLNVSPDPFLPLSEINTPRRLGRHLPAHAYGMPVHLLGTVFDEGWVRDQISEAIPADAAIIVLDTGRVYWFRGTCILGRNPNSTYGMLAIALPDLSRNLSANHVQLTLDKGFVLVTDLSTQGGTYLENGDGMLFPIKKYTPTALTPGAVLNLGGQRMCVTTAESAFGDDNE